VAQYAPMRADAGKEGQISNQFKADLFQIIDFLDINKREIEAIDRKIKEQL
jgi:hypothetical protein